MQTLSRTLFVIALLFGSFLQVANAQVKLGNGTLLADKPYFIVSYIEAAPASAGMVAADPAKLANPTGNTVYVVTHADIIPPEQFAPCKRQVSEKGPCGNELIIELVNASRKHAGVARFDALTQANRPNHMTIVEMWASSKEQEAHQVTTDVRNFRDALSGIVPASGVAADPLFVLNPLTGSLYDERLYRILN